MRRCKGLGRALWEPVRRAPQVKCGHTRTASRRPPGPTAKPPVLKPTLGRLPSLVLQCAHASLWQAARWRCITVFHNHQMYCSVMHADAMSQQYMA